MHIQLHGKKALITGGSRGIGRAITLALATAGADVIACHRQDSESAGDLAGKLKTIPGDHHLVKADVSDAADVTRLVDECRDRFGTLDVVVNNAGAISHVPFADLSAAEWQRVIDTNVTGVFTVTQQVLPLLSPGASIILIGSKVAAVGVPLRAHYTASKAALVGMTRSLCKELGPRGIRINVLAPGIIDTVELAPEQTKRYQQIISLGRIGRPDEIANVATFLASDLSSYITGETINVDGGT